MPLIVLSSCGGGDPSETYFSEYEVAASSLAKTTKLEISSKSTSLKASFVDVDGDTLEVSTTPLAFTLRTDDIAASSVDEASIAFTMPASNTNLNKLTMSGAYLKKMTKVFSGGSIGCDISLYASGGNAYIDFKSSSMVRTILSEALQNQDYPAIRSNTNKLVFDAETKQKVDDYLPLSQYFDEATSSRLELFRDLYQSAPEGFTFAENEGSKTIAFTSKDKEKTKSIAMDLIKDEERKADIDKYFAYCNSMSLDYSVTFDENGPLSTSFSFRLSDFDIEKIKTDSPSTKLFPTGSMQIATKLDFVYPTDSISFPSFSGYREYVFEKTQGEAA